jgi:hypothetical protein
MSHTDPVIPCTQQQNSTMEHFCGFLTFVAAILLLLVSVVSALIIGEIQILERIEAITILGAVYILLTLYMG